MCKHLSAFLDKPSGRATIDCVRDLLASSSSSSSSSFASPASSSCNVLPPSQRIHACLHCATALPRSSIARHVKTHVLCMDAHSQRIYCAVCADYVYECPYARMGPHPVLGIRGLINMGNTCFLNCILQCLCSLPLMRNYFLSPYPAASNPSLQSLTHMISHSHTNYSTNGHGLGLGNGNGNGSGNGNAMGSSALASSTLYAAVKSIFTSFFSSSIEPIAPHELMYAVWNQPSSRIVGYEQQDAHEFFMVLLDAVVSDHPTIRMMFSGQMRSQLRCSQCGLVSTTLEPMLDLSLDLPQRATTLHECLEAFTASEPIDALSCSRCAKSVSAHKQMSLSRLPLALCIHIKRFYHGATSSKIDNYISFPLDALDIRPFASPTTKDHVRHQEESVTDLGCLYDCVAVVQHKGSLESGHYTSYVRRGPRWFHVDDDEVAEVDAETVKKCTAYMLFFERRRIEYAGHGAPCNSARATEFHLTTEELAILQQKSVEAAPVNPSASSSTMSLELLEEEQLPLDGAVNVKKKKEREEDEEQTVVTRAAKRRKSAK